MANTPNFVHGQYVQPNPNVYYEQNPQYTFTQQPASFSLPMQPLAPLIQNVTPYTQQSQHVFQPQQPSQDSQYMQHNILQNNTEPQYNQWHEVQNKKRLRSPEVSTSHKRQTKLGDYWLNVPVTNKFDALNEDKNTETDKDKSVVNPNPQKAPPIFVSGVKNCKPLTDLLNEIAENNYTMKATSSEEIKIQPKTDKIYSTIINALKEKNTDYHTYKPKSQRNFRVVLKGLHSSTDTNEVKQELSLKNHTVTNISNIKQYKTKKPLPMFYIELKQNENNKEIYKLNLLMNYVVQFEAPRVKREIPQCSRCQKFNHTKNFCNKLPNCVKCAEQHLTGKCPRKERDNKVKCVNCSGDHPANYRGCIVYKQLQQSKFPPLRARNITQQNLVPPTQFIQPGITFAQKARQNEPQQQNVNNATQSNAITYRQNNDDMAELRETVKKLTEQMSTMLNLLTILINNKPQ